MPNLGQKEIFQEKLLHYPKRVMVFHLYTKKYKKRSNGSIDIAITRIEQSDWSKVLGVHILKTRFFPKNPALSLFCIYGPLTSCKISEKTNESIPR